MKHSWEREHPLLTSSTVSQTLGAESVSVWLVVTHAAGYRDQRYAPIFSIIDSAEMDLTLPKGIRFDIRSSVQHSFTECREGLSWPLWVLNYRTSQRCLDLGTTSIAKCWYVTTSHGGAANIHSPFPKLFAVPTNRSSIFVATPQLTQQSAHIVTFIFAWKCCRLVELGILTVGTYEITRSST